MRIGEDEGQLARKEVAGAKRASRASSNWEALTSAVKQAVSVVHQSDTGVRQAAEHMQQSW